MKKVLTIFFIFVSFASFSQTGLIRYLQGSAPNFKRYVDTLKSLNLSSPLYKLNDTTIALDTSRMVMLDLTQTLTNKTLISPIFNTTSTTGYIWTATNSSGEGDWAAASGGGNPWNLPGNAATDTLTNFVGTTDYVPLLFRVNNKRAGFIGDSIVFNTAFGMGALRTGILSRASAVGANGEYNTAFGTWALKLNTTGYENTALGASALRSNTTGFENVAIGALALDSNTTGFVNTAIGFSALRQNISGSANMALGYRALMKNTASNNVAIGSSSMVNNTTGGTNVAVGRSSLTANTTGGDNTGLGDLAGQGNTTGSGNTSVGSSALYTNSTAIYNTAVGLYALNGSNAHFNTAVGVEALANTNSGSSNTSLGYLTMRLNTSGTNNIAIGAAAGRYTTTTSNQIFINSIDRGIYLKDQNASPIYAIQNLAPLSQTVTFNGKIGINKIVPTSFLHLTRGQTAASSAPLKFDVPVALTTTAATGDLTNATLTFATQTNPPFMMGSTIVVAGVTPAGYNGTHVVTAVTATTVSYSSAENGAQTVAGTVSQGAVMATPENGAVEFDGTNYFVTSGGVRYILTRTLTGTAAPATTPQAVGIQFVDTVNAKVYVSTGTASSADWTILN